MVRVEVLEPWRRGWLYGCGTGDLLVIVAPGDDVWAVLAQATGWAMRKGLSE